MLRHPRLREPSSRRKGTPSPPVPPPVHESKRLRCVGRRLFTALSVLASVLLIVFLAATLYLSARYNASVAATVPALARAIVFTLLKAGVSVYDPCNAHLARLGPDGSSAIDPNHLVRAESFFHFPPAHSLAHDLNSPIRILEITNASIVRSRFPFSYQPYEEPRLHELRRKYQLDEVIKGASSELEEFALLQSWTRSRFRRQDYQPLTHNFDALEVLDRNLKNLADEPLDPGKHLDPCHFFPLLYCQIVLTMGHTSRLVSIGHGMVEVWSNQFQKWVTMDAELDLHYEKNGIPLNMLEIRDENFQPGPYRVHLVRGQQAYASDVKKPTVNALIKSHLNSLVIVDMRNDWLTNHYFIGHPKAQRVQCLNLRRPPLALEHRRTRFLASQDEPQGRLLLDPQPDGNLGPHAVFAGLSWFGLQDGNPQLRSF